MEASTRHNFRAWDGQPERCGDCGLARLEHPREALAELLSRTRHPTRWEYVATSNIQDEDYAQADAVLDAGWRQAGWTR